MSHHYLETKKISFSYPDGTEVLQNINFRIEHGDSLAILGSNGAGKSTLIKHFNGLIQPQNGEVIIGGIKVSKISERIIMDKVGIVFQNTDNQLFMPTVFENIAFGLRGKGYQEDDIKTIVSDVAQKLSISDLLSKHPFKLSGGEKRKVCIASIVASSPEILILDEPTAELDPKSRHEIINILRSFNHTKVIATHDLELAKLLCNKSLLLKKGSIKFFGDTSDLLSNEELLKDADLIF